MGLAVRSNLTMAAAGGCIALGGLVLVSEAGAQLQAHVVSGTAAVVLGLTTLAALRSVAHARRGPAVVSFSRVDSIACEPHEAVAVRQAAQLRGTLGGAGHVYRARLAISAAAWLAATVFAGAVIGQPWRRMALCCGVIAILLSLVAARFPARPFFYREAMDGWVLVHPRDALDHIVVTESRSGEEPSETPPPSGATKAEDGWGSSLSAQGLGGKPPQVPDHRAP